MIVIKILIMALVTLFVLIALKGITMLCGEK